MRAHRRGRRRYAYAMPVSCHLLGPGEGKVLLNVAPGVFDRPIDPAYTAEFLADPRHHLAVALDNGRVVGMASAVHYLHPDKPPELWINEVGVAQTHRRRGIARQLLRLLLSRARELSCAQAWVLTDPENEPARRLYRGLSRADPRHQAMFEIDL